MKEFNFADLIVTRGRLVVKEFIFVDLSLYLFTPWFYDFDFFYLSLNISSVSLFLFRRRMG